MLEIMASYESYERIQPFPLRKLLGLVYPDLPILVESLQQLNIVLK